MFVGHFATGLAARALDRRIPFWAAIGASQLIDIAWAGLLIAGVEKVRIDPGLLGNPLDLYFMPYTHSLPAALLWGLGAALFARGLLGMPARPASIVGLVVASHWLLDFFVHRADLPLWTGGPKVGLGLWNLPMPEMVLEMTLLGVATVVLVSVRQKRRRSGWPVIAFYVLLASLQASASVSAVATSAAQQGWLALLAFFVAIAGGLAIDAYDRRQRQINALAIPY